jgi:outer membrane protein TolC
MKKLISSSLIILYIFSFFLTKALAEEVLTWQDCVKEAAKNHPDLISAVEGVKESQAGKDITKSGLYPQITGSASASTSTSGGVNTDTYKYGVSGTQLLFDAGKTIDKVKAGGENVKAAEYNYRFTSSTVRQRLRTAFISLLKAQELLRLTREIYNIRRSNLQLITLRYISGIEHRGAMMAAEANAAQAKFAISQNERALLSAQQELIKEMGRVKLTPLRAEGILQVGDLVKEKPDFEALIKNNPSLQKLIAQKNAASFGLKAARANFLPEISADAGADKSGVRLPPDSDSWNAGLSVSVPLFEGGLKTAELAQARALFNQAEAQERSTRDGLVLSLQQAWASLQDAAETVEVQDKFLSAAEERAKIAESQYSLGLIQFDNWTIIEDSLVNAKNDFLNAQVNAALVEANWVQAKGETLEYAP